MELGIKNSWKYEKDLMILFNLNKILISILRLSNFKLKIFPQYDNFFLILTELVLYSHKSKRRIL